MTSNSAVQAPHLTITGAGAVPVDDGENVMKTIDGLGRHLVSQIGRQPKLLRVRRVSAALFACRLGARSMIARDGALSFATDRAIGLSAN